MTPISSDITFEEAIAATEFLLEQVETNQLSPEQIGEAIAALAQSENGARGFFVTYLGSKSSLASHPSEELVEALRSSPEIVAELLAKNVAMSAAMALTHRRNDDEPMAQSSEQVRDRSVALIKLIDIEPAYECCRKLLESAVTGAGRYQAFLDRWGYDAEQRQLMCEALESAIAVPQTDEEESADEEEATEITAVESADEEATKIASVESSENLPEKER